MSRTIDRIKLIFVAIFAVAVAAIWGYQLMYGWPKEKCEANGGWFDPKSRQCGRVVYIPDITGRYVDDKGREQQVRLPEVQAEDAPAASR